VIKNKRKTLQKEDAFLLGDTEIVTGVPKTDSFQLPLLKFLKTFVGEFLIYSMQFKKTLKNISKKRDKLKKKRTKK